MRVLHVTIGLPEFRSGGATKYAYDLALQQQEIGMTVAVLYPGRVMPHLFKTMLKKRTEQAGVIIYELVNPGYVAIPFGIPDPAACFREVDVALYRELLTDFKPDMIHIHTFMGIHINFFEEVRRSKVPMFYTTHDYYVLCPRTNLINRQGEICFQYIGEECASCNADVSYNKWLQYMLQSRWYPKIKRHPIIQSLSVKYRGIIHNTQRLDCYSLYEEELIYKRREDFRKLKERYLLLLGSIDMLHCNSSVAQRQYGNFVEDGKMVVLPITVAGLKDNRGSTRKKKSKVLRFGYIGMKEFHKGFYLLLEAVKKLVDENLVFELHVFGDSTMNYGEYRSNIFDHGRYSWEQRSQIYEQMDMLVVPSICYETFGLIVLESLLHHTPVIVTETVGSGDILEQCHVPVKCEASLDGLSNILRYYIKNEASYEDYLTQIPQMELRFDMKQHTAEILGLYNLLLTKQGMEGE